MTDLLVIGAGITGSALASKARQRGWEVIVIDPDPSRAVSRLAFAVVRPAWFTGPRRRMAQESLDWYAEQGWTLNQGVATVSTLDGVIEPREGWWLVDPMAPLVKPDLAERAYRFDTRTGEVLIELGGSIAAKAVAVCAGVGSGRLGGERERPVWGRVAVSEHPAELDGPDGLFIRHLGPHRSVIVSRHGGQVKVGASRSVDRDRAALGIERLLTEAEAAGLIEDTAHFGALEGARAKPPGAPGRTVRLGARAWQLSGMGTVGYSLAPALADEALDAIGELV